MKSFIPSIRCLILLTAIAASSIGTAVAGEFSINVWTACETKDDNAPTTSFYAGRSRLKYFVQPDLYKNLADDSVSYTLSSNSGTELAFKDVHVEKGFIVLIVEAKAGAKASTVQFNITTR